VPRRGTYTEIIERTQGGPLLTVTNDGVSIDHLAATMTELVTDGPMRESLGRKAYDAVRTMYGARRMAERAAGVYASLADSAGEVLHAVPAV